jgi:hypothetical protein
MTALIAKAVEICALKRIPFLVYGKFVYGKKAEDSLAEFKRNSGFERFDIPRYFVPLSGLGSLALTCGFYHGLLSFLPRGALERLLRLRAWWHERRQI